ncbi:ankyrin repeat domain-containing protein [Pasteurella multocida]
MITEIIGCNIKELREKHKMSQQDLSDKLNTARPVISNWENGKSEPSSSQLLKIAKIFDTTTDHILGNVTNKEDIIVVDTSALIKRPSFIEELTQRFDEVIIPDIVISELNNLKDRGKENIKQKAWLIMKNIDSLRKSDDSNLVIFKNIKHDGNNDEKIADIAIRRAKSHANIHVYLLSDDIYFQFLASNVKNLTPITPKNYLLELNSQADNSDLVKSIEFCSLVKSNKLPEAKGFYQTGVDINLRDPESGLTPLITAVRSRNKDMIKFLLGFAHLDIDKHDEHKYYFSAIHHATQLKNLPIIKLLAEHNADIDLGSNGKNSGNTPLMISAWSGFNEGVDFYIENGACANQQDSNGYTALMKACIKNNEEIIKKLVPITDINIRSKENKKAIDYLDPSKINYQNVKKLFEGTK